MAKVGKQRLGRLVADKLRMPEATVRRILEATFAAIVDELARGRTVSVTGFGSWRTKVYAPRTGRNPSTGTKMDIPPRTRVVFRAGSKLRDLTESSLDAEIFFGHGIASLTELHHAFARLFGAGDGDVREGMQRLAQALNPSAQEEADQFFRQLLRQPASTADEDDEPEEEPVDADEVGERLKAEDPGPTRGSVP
jgi:DNA-binding protein HU-beta